MWITLHHPLRFAAFFLAMALSGCLLRPRGAPPLYTCGFVETKAKKIARITEKERKVLSLQPGEVIADVGTSGGYRMGMLSVFCDSLTIYLQDIDSTCLNIKEVEKVWNWYAWVRGEPLTNRYRIVIGDETESRLPNRHFDKIHVTATFHHFSQPEIMLADLRQKLQTHGKLYIIENVVDEPGQCRKRLCPHPLRTQAELVGIFERSGFRVASVHSLNRPYTKIFTLVIP